MNLTATRSGGWGYFTLYAAQTIRGTVSNLNVNGPGQTIANHAICRISNQGVRRFSYDSAHIICDVTGWYTGAPASNLCYNNLRVCWTFAEGGAA